MQGILRLRPFVVNGAFAQFFKQGELPLMLCGDSLRFLLGFAGLDAGSEQAGYRQGHRWCQDCQMMEVQC